MEKNRKLYWNPLALMRSLLEIVDGSYLFDDSIRLASAPRLVGTDR
jgi:hypothetical protein